MTGNDLARWAREFYPVFDREGLVIDLRNNNGGNIDSILLEKLMRRAWGWWKPRDGSRVFQNQQMAFRGHVVAIIDGHLLRWRNHGRRAPPWHRHAGGQAYRGCRRVALRSKHALRQRHRARGRFGQFVPGEGWIVEGTGVAPDIEIGNPPAATYRGEDAQLAAAIKVLNEKLAAKPVVQPVVPAYRLAGVRNENSKV